MHQSLPRCLRNRDHVLLNGVDLKRFTPRDRAAARGELGWPLEGKVAIFVAAHPETPLKRLWLAKAAVDRAREEATDLRLEIISGVSPDQMPMIMAAADCLLHTSASEGSPNVVKEAMACNLPVAATPVGDIPSLLTDVDGAAVCDPTPEHLADGILRCLRAGHSNGRAKAWQFDHLRVTKRLIDLYEAIAPG
jgi:glycosyltransferase involved in cell wall biosynthesis